MNRRDKGIKRAREKTKQRQELARQENPDVFHMSLPDLRLARAEARKRVDALKIARIQLQTPGERFGRQPEIKAAMRRLQLIETTISQLEKQERTRTPVLPVMLMIQAEWWSLQLHGESRVWNLRRQVRAA